MLRWVFLDVGNVLFNDDPAMAFLYSELHHAMCGAGYRLPFSELLAQREALIRAQGPEHWHVLGRRYLGEDGHERLMRRCAGRMRADYLATHTPVPGAVEMAARLSERYRLGVVANQLKEVVGALHAIGIGERVRVFAISEEIGIRKPDPGIYRWALEKAECAPEEAVMVGDRVDNDVVPARAVGMWTVLLQMPHEAKGGPPEGEMNRLYFESQLRESICRIPPRLDHERPDQSAADLPGLLDAIEAIRRRAENGARPGDPSGNPPTDR